MARSVTVRPGWLSAISVAASIPVSPPPTTETAPPVAAISVRRRANRWARRGSFSVHAWSATPGTSVVSVPLPTGVDEGVVGQDRVVVERDAPRAGIDRGGARPVEPHPGPLEHPWDPVIGQLLSGRDLVQAQALGEPVRRIHHRDAHPQLPRGTPTARWRACRCNRRPARRCRGFRWCPRRCLRFARSSRSVMGQRSFARVAPDNSALPGESPSLRATLLNPQA